MVQVDRIQAAVQGTCDSVNLDRRLYRAPASSLIHV